MAESVLGNRLRVSSIAVRPAATRLPVIALAGLLAAIAVLFVFGQSRFYFDYAWQAMSVRDYARGDTDSPFVMRSADPADLTRDRIEWTIGYPLGYNAVGALITRAGFGAATAHRLIGAGVLIVGILGWHFFFAHCVALSPAQRAGALLAVSLSFNGLPMLAFMMPEVFLFASVPWQLWSLHRATELTAEPRRRLWLLGVLGATTGLAYTFRYLAALHGLPLLALAAIWLARRRPTGWVRGGFVLAATAAAPVAAMSLLNLVHTGAINSTGENLPWSVAFHWPDLAQWLLVVTGPAQALFGAAFLFGRTGAAINHRWHLASDFHAQTVLNFALALVPLVLAAVLIARHAPRTRLLAAGLLGAASTSLGLLWLFARSGIPQTDPRYFVAPALLLLPSMAVALARAWPTSARWRITAALWLAPYLLAVLVAIYALGRNLFALESGGRGTTVAAAGVNPSKLLTEVRARLPVPEPPIVWMCFQPGVLYALDGRHVFESYAPAPVAYRAATPVTLVVLRDRAKGMNSSIYTNNYRELTIESHRPDFVHGDYDVFIRTVGSRGPEPVLSQP